MYDVSVIVTTYNAEDTVNRAVSSLLHKPFIDRIEIIIVDDCSKDNTPEIIKNLAEQYDNIKAVLLDKNTGSPSEPRNIGMRVATGEYLTFMDDDDWIAIKVLLDMVDIARSRNLDCLKGYLTVVDQNGRSIANKITERKHNSIIEDIISQQSTTADIILRRDFVLNNKIQFDSSLKIGEDTVFYASVFAKTDAVDYVNKGFYFYNKIRGVELSTTQNYGDKEVKMHLNAWEKTERLLNDVGLSYYSLRLPIAVKNSVINFVTENSKVISKDVFLEFSRFVLEHENSLKNKIYLQNRYQIILDSVRKQDYALFRQVCKKRVVIAGYDLKFILPVVPYLEKEYTVLIDEWTGHNMHDEKKSKELLEQADIIWCEWLLGNAVWYAQNKMKHQKLVIRAHRFEITREFGYQVNYENVNKVIAVGYYYLEEFQRKFNIPRNKMILLSNYVEPSLYTGEKSENAIYHIGLVGITPRRKGFLKGLKIIKHLYEQDNRFELHIVGTKPQDTPWIMNNPVEKEYYEMCESFIVENNLDDIVKFKGWMSKDKMFNDLGFVLSLSDNEQPESFHLTPAEAYCDNTMGLFLAWPGVEYIYPQAVIFKNETAMERFIIDMVQHEELYQQNVEQTKQYIIDNYSVDLFNEKLSKILETL